MNKKIFSASNQDSYLSSAWTCKIYQYGIRDKEEAPTPCAINLVSETLVSIEKELSLE